LRIGMHAFFKAANAFANSAHHFRDFLSSEQEDDDRQNDQPMNWAKFSHVYLPSRGRRFNNGRFESPGINLKYNTLIPDSARQVLPIEIFEQWNRVLARHACKFLKRADGKTGPVLLAAFNQSFAQAFKSDLMKNQVIGDFHQHFFPEQNLQNLLRPSRFHRQLGEHDGEARDSQPGIRKFAFD
jgi:hypothetical protein